MLEFFLPWFKPPRNSGNSIFTYLNVLEFHRSRAAKNRYHNFYPPFIWKNFFNNTLKIGERPINHSNCVTFGKNNFWFGLINSVSNATKDLVRFLVSQ